MNLNSAGAAREPLLPAVTPAKARCKEKANEEWSPGESASTGTGGPHSCRSTSSGSESLAPYTPPGLVAVGRRRRDDEEDCLARAALFCDTDAEAPPVAVHTPAVGKHVAVSTTFAPGDGTGRVYWEGFFINMPVFCGYAALFGLQHEIKAKYGIGDSLTPASKEFGFAVSFLYIFNLVFRLLHNVIFGFMGPWGRTVVAQVSMIASMLVIAGPIMTVGSHHLGWVYLAYGLGGTAIGTFEGNLLCCLTPLGDQTKLVTISAIPFGIAAVLIGGFFAMGPPFRLPVTAIYLAVVAYITLGVIIFVTRIPRTQETGQAGIRLLALTASYWREWLPQFWHYPLATMFDLFSLSCFNPGVALYIWNGKTVSLAWWVLDTNTFFAVFSALNTIGGCIGRYSSYRITPRHPLWYCSFNALGCVVMLMKEARLALLGAFLITLGDGLIYGTITRHIDAVVPRRFNLLAVTFWLFVGDFGGVAGSSLIPFVRHWIT